MTAALKNEIVKLFTHKKYIVFMGIGIIISVFWSFLGNMIVSGISALTGTVLSMELGFTPTSSLPLFARIIMPLLIFMGVADLFTGELADLTIKASLIRPIHRTRLYAAKVLAIFTYTVLYMSVILCVGEITGLISGAVNTPAKFFGAVLSYVITLVPLAVLVSFAALIAMLFRSGSLVMFLLILSMLFLYTLPLVFGVLNELLFTSYLTWYRLWLGAVPAFQKTLTVIMLFLGYGATFTLSGMILFERRDV